MMIELHTREQKPQWVPLITAVLNYVARERSSVTLFLENQRPPMKRKGRKKKFGGPLVSPNDLQEWLGEVLRTSVFPPVFIAGVEPMGGNGVVTVQVTSTDPGKAEVLFEATRDWPRAFCCSSWLRVRTGASKLDCSPRAWEAALEAPIDWALFLNHKQKAKSEVGPDVAWKKFPAESVDLEYKSSKEWPLDSSKIRSILRDNWGPLLRGVKDFTITIGVDDKTGLPMGVMLASDVTAAEIASQVESLLGSYFPPLSAEKLDISLQEISSPSSYNMGAWQWHEEPAYCGLDYQKYLAKKKKDPTQLVLLKKVTENEEEDEDEEEEEEDGEEEEVTRVDELAAVEEGLQEVRFQYCLAEASDTCMEPASEVRVPLHVVSVRVRLSEESQRVQAAAMYMPSKSDPGTNSLPSVTLSGSHLDVGKDEWFSPLLFYLKSRQSNNFEPVLQQPHCTKVVLCSGSPPPTLARQSLTHFDVEKASTSLADVIASSKEHFALAILVLSPSSWRKIANHLKAYCCAPPTPKPLHLLVVAHEDIVTVTSPFFEELRSLVKFQPHMKPTVVDVLLLPPVQGDSFQDQATTNGFRLFDGRLQRQAHDTLLPDVAKWLEHGGWVPAEALAQDIVPTLNEQKQQLVDNVNKLMRTSIGKKKVEVMEASQLFRNSGTTTLLRQVAATSTLIHEDLIFLDRRLSASKWTQDMVDALADAPGPVIMVEEDEKDLLLLKKAKPNFLVIKLTSEMILGNDLCKVSLATFLVSPFVSKGMVTDVCDSLALVFPSHRDALNELKVLSWAVEPIHRHILVFIVGAVSGNAYLEGIGSYVDVELNRLLPDNRPGDIGGLSDNSRKFLAAVAFFGAFASPTSRLVSMPPKLQRCMAPIEVSGSLLLRFDDEQVAIWHPWAARELLLRLAPSAQEPASVGKTLTTALDQLLYLSEKERLLEHLLFDRTGPSFSLLMKYYLDHSQEPSRAPELPIDDLQEFIPRDPIQKRLQLRTGCHVLLSRACRYLSYWDKARLHAGEAIAIESKIPGQSGPSFVTRHNAIVVALYEACDGKQVDYFALERALRDLARLGDTSPYPESRKKVEETAKTFIAKWDVRNKLQKELEGLFKIGPVTPLNSTLTAEALEHYPGDIIINPCKHNMPSMAEATLKELLSFATTAECR